MSAEAPIPVESIPQQRGEAIGRLALVPEVAIHSINPEPIGQTLKAPSQPLIEVNDSFMQDYLHGDVSLTDLSRSDLLFLGRLISDKPELEDAKSNVYGQIAYAFANDFLNTASEETPDRRKFEDFIRIPGVMRHLITTEMEQAYGQRLTLGDEGGGLNLLVNESSRKVETYLMRELINDGFEVGEAKDIVLSWETVQEGDLEATKDTIFTNLDRIQELREIDPGLALRLYRERGIAHFSRYSTDLLEAQFKPLPKGASPDFMILARSDHNQAFTYSVSVIEADLVGDLDTLRIAEAKNIDDFMARLDTLFNSNGYLKAKNMIIGAHGSVESMILGEKESWNRDQSEPELTIEEVQARFSAFRQMIEPTGQQILISCSTGAEGAIGEHANQISGLATQAPVNPSNIVSMQRDREGYLHADFSGGRSVKRHLPKAA